MKSRAILLIEDNEADATFFERALRNGGFENPLFIVRSAEDAMSYLRGEGKYANRGGFPLPDLIVLDLTLPGKSGAEVCKWIRGIEQFRRIPIAVLGGNGSPAEEQEVRDCGANAYHLKPNSPDELQAIINRLISFWLMGGWTQCPD